MNKLLTSNRGDCDEIVKSLTSNGVSARSYLVDKLKTREDWLAGHFQVICSPADKFDIDRKDVRLTLHYRPPKSIEDFCNEAGGCFSVFTWRIY